MELKTHTKSEKDKLFKEAIGGFIIATSEMEFAIAKLCAFAMDDTNLNHIDLSKPMGRPFSDKRNILKKFINENLNNLISEWEIINIEIGDINLHRRHLVHGFIQYRLPNETIETYINNKGKITKKVYSLDDIKELTRRIQNLNTGANGISGVFYDKFVQARVNLWNKSVNDNEKIVFKINGRIVT